MRGTNRRGTAGLLAAAFLVVSLSLGGPSVSAAPTEQELADARAQLRSLNERLSLLVEEYNQAKVRLGQTEARLADVRSAAAEAKAEAEEAREALSARARRAYTGTTPSLQLLLGSQDFGDFAASVQFLATLAARDADAANQAELSRRRSELAERDLAGAVEERRALLRTLDERRSQIESSIADQQVLIRRLETDLAAAEARAAQAASRASREATGTAERVPQGAAQDAVAGGTGAGSGSSAGASGGGSGGGAGNPGGGGSSPGVPPVSPGADAAVAAAYDAIGVPYVWGGSSPEEGFDCSGLTMWSWAHGGVSLPHSSQMQYNVLPKVPRDQIQAGDLLFFYTPISHVAIYVGDNQMIQATNPSELSHLETISSYWWDVYVGAGRPG